MDTPRPHRQGSHTTSRLPRPIRPGRARDTIEVPRAWLIALVGGLFAALLVVAFLIGRESGSRSAEVASVDAPAAASTDRQDPTFMTGGEMPPVRQPPKRDSPDKDHQLAPWALEESFTDAGRQSAGRPELTTSARAAGSQGPVAAYFAEIERYERRAKYWSDPQVIATSLVAQAAQGDTSGMSQLLATQRAVLRQVEAMTVPRPCEEHHRRSVALLQRAMKLLEEIQGGFASGNLEGLLALSGESSRLEADTREVDALAAQIKRQYGLPDS